jgi:LysR family transcriptional regulator, transcriptional activator of nhaA
MPDVPRWLNLHQLQCFRVIAREGSLARASAVLRVSAQTLSEHVQQLEGALGVTLFTRGARGMSLTDTGREVLGYAEGIHMLGQELLQSLDGHTGSSAPLRVGVDESLPKLEVWSLLAPAARFARLMVHEGSHEDLTALLCARSLDLVIAESPAPLGDPTLRGVLLREEPLGWFASADAAEALREAYPASLHAAPVLLAAPGSSLREAAERWFAGAGARPRVVAEFCDTALAKAACADGIGVMVLPRGLAGAAARYGLREVGPCEGVTQRVYAITTAHREGHPAVRAVRCGAEAAEGKS